MMIPGLITSRVPFAVTGVTFTIARRNARRVGISVRSIVPAMTITDALNATAWNGRKQMNCPNCKKTLTAEQIKSLWAKHTSSLRKVKRGGHNGGRPKSKKVAEVTQ